MSKIIEEIKKKYGILPENKEKIHSLVLDAIEIKEIDNELKAFLEQFTNTKCLSMVMCQLRSLKNFPDLPNLESLDLSDNILTGSDSSFSELKRYPKLSQVLLANNQIPSLSILSQFLEHDKKFHHVDLSENPLSEVSESDSGWAAVSEKAFKEYPGLEFFNQHDKNGEEIPEEEDGEGEEDDEENEDMKDFLESDEEDEVDLEEGGDEEEEVERERKEKEKEKLEGKENKEEDIKEGNEGEIKSKKDKLMELGHEKKEKNDNIGKIEKHDKNDSDTKASEEKDEDDYVPGKVKKSE